MKKQKYIVEATSLSKSFRLGEIEVRALNDLSIKIEASKFTSIVGPSGSGKTTLMNLIGCIDKPDVGQIKIGNVDVLDFDENQLTQFRAKEIGFVFQNFNLFPVLTALENVEFPLLLLGEKKESRREKALDLLTSIGLGSHVNHRPNQLSGGQQQRVAVARALVKRPSIVIADEPTANLDSKSSGKVVELMKKMQEDQGVSFFFSTHDPELMKYAEVIHRIHDGKILEH